VGDAEAVGDAEVVGDVVVSSVGTEVDSGVRVSPPPHTQQDSEAETFPCCHI